MLIFTIVVLIIILGAREFLQQPQFGKIASGFALTAVTGSPNYKGGKFKNLSYTPNLKEGVSYVKVMKNFFFGKSKRSRPASILPSLKTNLLTLDPEKDALVWFGHSSYFLQIDGKKFLVDPVFSGNASPVNFTTKSFDGSDVYTVDDMPNVDYLLISHDHYDHLDYKTVTKLQPKVKRVITGLGVGSHLEAWGYDTSIIEEKDWDETVNLGDGFFINTTSARHFSGRGLKRDNSLWLSFVLTTPTMKIFIGGDSGYDDYYKRIGNDYGPFDLAILECGQYNEYWKYIHMMPEETVQAAQDLKAKKLLPVHWSKFSLALHAWDEPIIRVSRESRKKNVAIMTPVIGEEVDLKRNILFPNWWEKVV